MEIFEKIIAILKLPFRFIFTIAFILGLVLFLPESIITQLQLAEFKTEYGKFIGIVFLISAGYLAVSLIIYFWNKIRIKIVTKNFKKNIVEVLNSLTLPDIYLLREFILQGKDVIEVPYESTEFTSLYNKSILVLASNNVRSFIFGKFVSVTINPVVKKYITFDVLRLPKGQPTEQEFEEIKKHRPDYLSSLNYVDSLMKNIGRFGM